MPHELVQVALLLALAFLASKFARQRFYAHAGPSVILIAALLLGFNLTEAWSAGYRDAHDWKPVHIVFSSNQAAKSYPSEFRAAVTANTDAPYAAQLLVLGSDYLTFALVRGTPQSYEPLDIIIVKKDDIRSVYRQSETHLPSFTF